MRDEFGLRAQKFALNHKHINDVAFEFGTIQQQMHPVNCQCLRHVRLPDDVSVRFIRFGGFEFLIDCRSAVCLYCPRCGETRQAHLINHNPRQRLARRIRRDDNARLRVAQTRNLWHAALIRNDSIRPFGLVNHEDN